MVKGRVSIIVPMYNASNFLKYTVDSCLNQTYKDKEIVLIDDCSNDNTYSIATEYEKNNYNIRTLKNKENRGLIKTINTALDFISGEYVLILGNDDILGIDHLEVMVQALSSDEELSFAYCKSVLIDENGEEFGETETIDINRNMCRIAYTNPINSCGLLMKTESLFAVEKYPVIDGCPNYGEWLLWIKMLESGKALFVDQAKSYYRIHANNLTKTFMDKNKIQKNYSYNLICMDRAVKCLNFNVTQKLRIEIRKLIYMIKMFYHFRIKR